MSVYRTIGPLVVIFHGLDKYVYSWYSFLLSHFVNFCEYVHVPLCIFFMTSSVSVLSDNKLFQFVEMMSAMIESVP